MAKQKSVAVVKVKILRSGAGQKLCRLVNCWAWCHQRVKRMILCGKILWICTVSLSVLQTLPAAGEARLEQINVMTPFSNEEAVSLRWSDLFKVTEPIGSGARTRAVTWSLTTMLAALYSLFFSSSSWKTWARNAKLGPPNLFHVSSPFLHGLCHLHSSFFPDPF